MVSLQWTISPLKADYFLAKAAYFFRTKNKPMVSQSFPSSLKNSVFLQVPYAFPTNSLQISSKATFFTTTSQRIPYIFSLKQYAFAQNP